MMTLKKLYEEELQDLWSANDQMYEVVGEMAQTASDPELADRLRRARKGIQQHTEMLKSLLEACRAELKKNHCKGMEGLVREAYKHALDAELPRPVLDVAIIVQYQRMCHYGLAGFATARAIADALGEDDAADSLERALDHIYGSDEFMSDLAERAHNLAASG